MPSHFQAPPEGVTGGICPKGGYCPRGAKVRAPCPAGKYNNETGAKQADDCVLCPAG